MPHRYHKQTFIFSGPVMLLQPSWTSLQILGVTLTHSLPPREPAIKEAAEGAGRRRVNTEGCLRASGKKTRLYFLLNSVCGEDLWPV